MVNWYLVWSFIMLAIFLPAGIIMIVLYLYNDAKINFFGRQKLEAEKLRMITELAAHKKELERLKRKKTTEDKVKLVRKLEPDTRSISTTRFDSLTAAKKPIDATWLFKLTGIGRSGGFMYATVDGKDYKIGDNFGGMTIFKIERNQVFCTKLTKDGPINYIVGFRR